jgi:hypothetical protein
VPQVLGEAGTMTDGANAGAGGAPPRRGIGGGGVVRHRRVVRGNGAAHMCREVGSSVCSRICVWISRWWTSGVLEGGGRKRLEGGVALTALT